jgi:RNA polymerase sigma factor (sigma-70 family)
VSDEHERERFERVFRGCYEAVYAYAARRVAPEAVQDVVSETFLVAWRRYAELEGEPLPWLYGIARRVAANQLRGSARREALRRRLHTERPVSEAGELGARDPRLAAALAALGERDREALRLVAWEGLDHRGAATTMGCSTGAFAVRVHRARRKLARALASEETSLIEIPQEARSPL